MPASAPRRPRNRFRAETRFPARPRLARVAAIDDVAPGLRRVLLDAGVVGRGDRGAFDDVVVLHFPDGRGRVQLPAEDSTGGLLRRGADHLGGDRWLAREYTVRHRDPDTGMLTVDFALHGGGLADDWVRGARVGDALGVVGPRMSRALPELPELIAVGDATAIPALSRLIEETPAGTRLRVFVVADRSMLGSGLAVGPNARVHWLEPDGDPVGRLAEVLASEPVPAHGWAWIAGESELVTACRRLLRDGHGLDRDRIQFTGYWRRGAASEL